MTSYTSETIKSFSEYLHFIEKNCEEDIVLFRGQRCDKPLVPRIARLKLRGAFRKTEKEMFDDFRRRALPYLDSKPENKWDWLALAQHHNMATRLLDWTLNPLAALWFAVRKPPTRSEKGRQVHGVIWVLFPDKSDFAIPKSKPGPFRLSETKVFQPRHIAKRIVAQSGWFTIHKFMPRESKFIPLERNKKFSKKLIKLRIAPKEFFEMRFQLDRLGINSASLFTDLDGLCSHIQWDNSFLEDEPTIVVEE